ncbi:hypothetical protein GOBAR_DD25271 [Gossypium barbadense]|nr:hypothetical protein GOBAR_DD25271 [Gossypium barbadense]
MAYSLYLENIPPNAGRNWLKHYAAHLSVWRSLNLEMICGGRQMGERSDNIHRIWKEDVLKEIRGRMQNKVVEGAIDGENLKWLEKCIVGRMRNNATVGLWGDTGIYKIGVQRLSGNDLYELEANEWGDVLQVFQKVERWTTKMKE